MHATADQIRLQDAWNGEMLLLNSNALLTEFALLD
jgi:hypothetical protein